MLRLRILHLADAQEWSDAVAAGRYEVSSRGRSLADEGFIHASTSVQAAEVLDRYYDDYDADQLQVLVLDVGLLEAAGSPVRWDEVELAPGRTERFPHIYGPIPPSAAVAVLWMGGVTNDLELPDLTGLDVATSAPT